MRAVLLSLILAAPALAEPVRGIDDPGFRQPFDRALQTDDPLAAIDLHRAALAGNTAALLALPTALDWFAKDVPSSVRRQITFINDVPLFEAVVRADPVAAAWGLMGGVGQSDMDDLLQRAFALYAAGEADKATALFLTWQHQTPADAPLPPGFFDHPVPDWAMSLHLADRLAHTGGDAPAQAEALVAERLKADDPAAWMALARLAGLPLPADMRPKVDEARIDRILTLAGYAPADGAARMAGVVPVLRALKATIPMLDAQTALAAVDSLSGDPEFAPLKTFCEQRCPATARACAAAYLAGFGHPQGQVTAGQPFVSLIAPDAFFASPRGQRVLLKSTHRLSGANRAGSPVQTALRQIDACLADAVLNDPR
jgi:hypothetical protein